MPKFGLFAPGAGDGRALCRRGVQRRLGLDFAIDTPIAKSHARAVDSAIKRPTKVSRSSLKRRADVAAGTMRLAGRVE